jgi:hypothetical protein
MDSKVKNELKKLCMVLLCSPVNGQIMLDAVLKPPQVGDPSYELFNRVNLQLNFLQI